MPRERKPAAPRLPPFTVRIEGWHPWKKNQLQKVHWGTAHRRKKGDAQVIAAHCWLAGVPAATGKRRVSLTIVLGPRQKGGDVDAYHLSLLDGLKACKAILDDRKEACELAPTVYERGERAATIITLENIE